MNDLRLLELAVALDQLRSFGRAAEAMGMTQPTFSRGIAALEKGFGVRMFDRTNRRVAPTPAGQLVLARARNLLADAAAIRDAVADYQNLRSGRVTIGVGPYPLDISVIECIVRLASRRPLLEVEIIEGRWREFGTRLLTGELELAIMDSSFVAADSRFRIEALPVHQGCFYCRAGHPLADRSGVTLQEVLEYPLVGVRLPQRILPPPKPGTHGISIDPMTGDLTPHITMTSIATSRAIVTRTDGIGMAVPMQVAQDVHQGTLAILDCDTRNLRTSYGITSLRARTLSPAAEVFVSVLREVEEELAAASQADFRPSKTVMRKNSDPSAPRRRRPTR
jgi:DNA-binding transcriptional LysR family regulator